MTTHMKKLFKKIGLDNYQSTILEYLIKNGENKPSQLSQILDIKRPTVYKALYELEELQLVKRHQVENSDDLFFKAKSPYFLKEHITKRRQKIESLEKEFDSQYAQIIEMFMFNHKEPVIDIKHGIDGLKEIHLEIENLKTPIKIIRSSHDRTTEELTKEIDRHVSERSRLKIPTQILTPSVDTIKYTKMTYPKVDGREIKVFPQDQLNISSQIMLYNNNLVLTNYGEDNAVISLVIHQKEIYKSFEKIFEILWQHPNSKPLFNSN